MNNELISKIHNNTRSLILMKSFDKTYVVITKEGTTYKTDTFLKLVDALKYYNDLSELLFDRHTGEEK